MSELVEGQTSQDRNEDRNAQERRDGRDETIRRLSELVERQARQIDRLLERDDRQRQQNSVPQMCDRELASERFQKNKPPTFRGEADPRIAEEWIRDIEGIFEYARVPEEEKVTCAKFLLQMDARHWWDSTKATRDVARMTWDEFKEVFYEKYFNEAHRITKAAEFVTLKQGSMSVGEYIRKFEELSRFAPHMVATNQLKVNQFL